MMDNISLISRYFSYLVFAKTKYYLHSPFVYNLMVNVIQDDRHFYAFDEIENLKTALQRSKQKITINEQGAGSRKMSNTRSIKQISKIAAISAKKGQFLFRLVNYFNCTNILELGTSIGLGTAYLSKANYNNNITTIEACTNTLKIGQQNFEELGINNVNTINTTFSNFFDDNSKKQTYFDLVYIDGDHKKEATISYFKQLLNFKKESSVFVFDDINWSKGMYEAWQYIKGHPEVTLSINLFQVGLIFFKKDQAKEHFQLYF